MARILVIDESQQRETIRSTVKAGVAAYVVDGFEIGRLKPVVDVAVARFDEHQALRRELANAKRSCTAPQGGA